MALGGGRAVQSDGLCCVCSNASTCLIHVAQVVLSVCIPLCRCKAVQSHSLGIVLRNTSTIIVADPALGLRFSPVAGVLLGGDGSFLDSSSVDDSQGMDGGEEVQCWRLGLDTFLRSLAARGRQP